MKLIKLYLKIWRQENVESKGYFESHKIKNINSHMSFLEMLLTILEKMWLVLDMVIYLICIIK